MNSTEDVFADELKKKTEEAQAVIERFLPKAEGPAATVIEAMNYSVEAGGKRLRPVFLMEVAKMYGAEKALYEPFMAALEMIHTYSLIHDDLPAMDNDRYRRGRLTTWAVYGDGMAVIAGDGLLNYAFETAAGAFDACHDLERMRRCAKALQVLGRNAGIYGMVGGQCADLVSEKAASPVSEDTLLFIHRNKTAALIDSGLVIGAVLAGAPEEDIRKLHQIAEEIGLAFQIRDDILDVSGSQETLGKSIGKDAAEGKATYVSMHGLDAASKEVSRLTNSALLTFDGLGRTDPFLRDLLEALVTRTK